MLEPISPFHNPQKPKPTQNDTPLGKSEEANDNEGYSFRFFHRKKKEDLPTKEDEKQSENEYNLLEDNAVNVSLSPEAIQKNQRQRQLKKQKDKRDKENHEDS
jgi:hypothetical protein